MLDEGLRCLLLANLGRERGVGVELIRKEYNTYVRVGARVWTKVSELFPIHSFLLSFVLSFSLSLSALVFIFIRGGVWWKEGRAGSSHACLTSTACYCRPAAQACNCQRSGNADRPTYLPSAAIRIRACLLAGRHGFVGDRGRLRSCVMLYPGDGHFHA